MSKLLLLDKDGTLIKPASGHEFVQHPEDQELLPGVAERIAEYAAAGWTMVIVSNQGGCAWHSVAAKEVRPGAWLKASTIDGALDEIKVSSVEHAGEIVTAIKGRDADSNSYIKLYSPDEILSIRYKTLDDAIAEMQFCVRLLEDELQMLEIVEMVLMCPDFEGHQCWDCREGLRQDLRDVIELHTNQFTKHLAGTFRKPGAGMLEAAKIAANAGFAGISTQWSKCLMVGDRPEDQQAAANAGVEFMWADEWRNTPLT